MDAFDWFMVAVVGNLLAINVMLGGVLKKLGDQVRVERDGRNAGDDNPPDAGSNLSSGFENPGGTD